MFNTINNLSFDNVEIKTRLNNTNENVQKLVERVLVDEIEQKANHHRISKNTTHIRRNTKALTRIDKDLENETLTNAPTAIIGNDTITFTETDLIKINPNIILDNQEKFPINITIMETYNMDEDMLIKTRIDYKYYKISVKKETIASITTPEGTTEETVTNENGVITITTITTDITGKTTTTTTKTPTDEYRCFFFLGRYDKENDKMNITKLDFDNLLYSSFSGGDEGGYDRETAITTDPLADEEKYAIIGFCEIKDVKYIMCYYSKTDTHTYYIIFYNVVDNRDNSTLTGLAIQIPLGTNKYFSKLQYVYKKYLPVKLTAEDADPYFIGILLEHPNTNTSGTTTNNRVLLRIAPNVASGNKFAYNPCIATITDGSNNYISDLLHVQGHTTQINKEDINIYYYAIINNKIYVMNNDFTGYSINTEAKTITITPTKTIFNKDAEGTSIKSFSSFDNIKIANLIDYRYTDITLDNAPNNLVKGVIMVEYDINTPAINYYYPTIKKNATTDIYEQYTISLANKKLLDIRSSKALINISCNGSLFNTFDKGGTKYYYLTRENKELYLWNIRDFLFNNISDTYLWCDSDVDFFNAIIISSPLINKNTSDQFVDISVSYVIHRCYPIDMIKSFKTDNSITHINKVPNNTTTKERSSAKTRSIRTIDLRKNKDTEEASEISKSYSSYSDDTTTTSTTTTKQKQEQQKQQQKPKQRGGFWRRRNNVEQSDTSERSTSRSASGSRRRFAKI